MESVSTNASILISATAFAAHKHRDQRRKDADASPYINHPIALASVLINEAGISDPIVLAAALLHDTIEDTSTTFEELASAFGPEIAAIVLEVTDDKSLPKQERKQRQIDHAAATSSKAKLVKLADKICNLRDLVTSPPPDWSTDRKREYFDWASKVVDGLRGTHPQLESIFDQAYADRPHAKVPALGEAPVYWNVNGVPVSAMPTPDGGATVRAFDVAGGRPVPLSLALDDGQECGVEEFERLKRLCSLGVKI